MFIVQSSQFFAPRSFGFILRSVSAFRFTDIDSYKNILFPTDSTGSTFFPPVFRPTGTLIYIHIIISRNKTHYTSHHMLLFPPNFLNAP